METPDKQHRMSRRKLLAVSLIALLAVGSIAAVSLVEAAQPGASPFTTQGTMQGSGEYLEIVVWTQLNGSRVAVPSANVTIYSVSYAPGANGTIVITLTPVANGTTNSHGAAYFNLPDGRYVVIAHHDGMKGATPLYLRYYTTKFVRLNASSTSTG